MELAEASREFSWKSWARDMPFNNRERILPELVDVAHFVANMLTAMGVDDEEWESAYREKQQINRQRQLDGYTARKETS